MSAYILRSFCIITANKCGSHRWFEWYDVFVVWWCLICVCCSSSSIDMLVNIKTKLKFNTKAMCALSELHWSNNESLLFEAKWIDAKQQTENAYMNEWTREGEEREKKTQCNNDDDSRQSFLQEINYIKQDEVIFTSGCHNNIARKREKTTKTR